MLLSGFCLTLWAWCLLSLGLPRHQRTMLAEALPASRQRALRIGGWALLAFALGGFVGWRGWAQGPVFWAVAMMLAAIVWVLLMTLWPRRGLAVIAALSALALGGLLLGG